MSRILTVLMLAAVMIGGAAAAQAYHLPVDHYEDGYQSDPLIEADDPYFEDDPDSAYLDIRHRHGGYYGRPRHYDGYRGHDDHYPEYDRPYHGVYPEYYHEDRFLHDEEPGNVRERDRGFDPRRPHLGDGTDAPPEQRYLYRPRSCGEYYYWDGRACVDARKYPPYVGPRR